MGPKWVPVFFLLQPKNVRYASKEPQNHEQTARGSKPLSTREQSQSGSAGSRRELYSAVPNTGTIRACDDCSQERRDFFDCSREHKKRVNAPTKMSNRKKKCSFVEMPSKDLRALVPDSSFFAQQLIQRNNKHTIVQSYSRSFWM